MSRRELAKTLGHPDTSAGIPEARWMRAMTFEGLVRHERFVSELLTTAVGRLGLERPLAVRRADGKVAVAKTATALQQAHLKAVHEQVATMITGLAVPFVGFESDSNATPVKPDFAIVTYRPAADGQPAGSWLVMGDAKDYERVRSRIDDQRMLKGFLQVALGAESVAAWSLLPKGMIIHSWGALAVPRNAFLQPEAVVERLDDHRAEVRTRVSERNQLRSELGDNELPNVPPDELADFVGHLEATFDPGSCSSCSLFNYCRSELRASTEPKSLLIELGVRPEQRSALIPVVHGGQAAGRVPESLVAVVHATVTGQAQSTGQCRIDPVGQPGAVNVVLAKSDAAALGVYGIGLQRVVEDGTATPWAFHAFDDPQSPGTRAAVMGLLGEQIAASMVELAAAGGDEDAIDPIHLVLPDAVTGDVLVSIADSLAGVETSRLRWERDLEMGRPALTFDGEPATVPPALTDRQRLAVSFLLEDDRARAMVLRCPLVDLRALLARHVVPGGPTVDAGRLDYLVRWACASTPLDHRAVSDDVAASVHTPGARLSNTRSDAIHVAQREARSSGDPSRYRALIVEELGFKASMVDGAGVVLAGQPGSALRPAYRALERSAQAVWRRRLGLHASDLVRFGRVNRIWRNDQVEMRDADLACGARLRAVGNPNAARDLALDAGTRDVALATVVATGPVRLSVHSRRLRAGSTVVVLHVNGSPCVEAPGVEMKVQKGSFKFRQFSLGELVADEQTEADGSLRWEPKVPLAVAVGDELIVADRMWFGKALASGHEIAIARPDADDRSAPKPDCGPTSFSDEPEDHKWCCRSHESAEAEWADELAARRARGELNPQAWPPVIDEDQFDVAPAGSPTGDETTDDPGRPADGLTIDDLD